MALYPPILASSQDAFLASSDNIPIYFTLSNLTDLDDVSSLQVKIVYQSNNKPAGSGSDGIVTKNKSNFSLQSSSDDIYFVTINSSSDLRDRGWISNKYYKVQMRFVGTELGSTSVSEWSTVMVIKAISTPSISIVNRGNGTGGSGDLIIESAQQSEVTTSPLFTGTFSCTGEIEDTYRFELYDSEDNLIESTGWLRHNAADTYKDTDEDNNTVYYDSHKYDTCRFKNILTDDENYRVTYSVITLNGYQADAVDYEFLVHENYLTKLTGITLSVVDSTSTTDPYASENGCLVVKLTSSTPLSGNYVITRTSEKSNYAVWDDMKYLVYFNDTPENETVYIDYTVESGIKYKYAIQQENRNGLRTAPLYEKSTIDESPARVSNFQYSYLYADGVQLKLRLSQTMNSFKHSVLAAKQDTLGSKYPTVNRNGIAYYAEFPISAMVSMQMDDYETFFQRGTDGYYYKDELIIPSDKYDEEDPKGTYRTNFLIDNNYFIERMFREKVEEFLNDGGYKLYKSPTEGNIVVTLINVSFAPNSTLGRLIATVSATAYEVMEPTLENLEDYGLIEVGEFQSDISEDSHVILLGQVAGLYDTSTNLIDVIKEQNEYDIGGGYQYTFQNLKSLEIEAYPDIDFTAQLSTLEAQLSQAKSDEDTELIEELTEEIEELEALNTAVTNQVDSPVVTMYINGKPISLGLGRTYHLEDSSTITSLQLKYEMPIIINYTCEVSSEESTTTTISEVVYSSVWGQVSGIFTNTTSILNNYQLSRGTELEVSTENNMNLYQSIDITEVVEEQVRHQIENSYNTTFTYDSTIGQWTNGTIYYTFEKFSTIDIEADSSTKLIITNSDGTTQEVLLGPTCRYRLENLDKMATHVTLAEPSFAIVNYRCSTMQTKMGG